MPRRPKFIVKRRRNSVSCPKWETRKSFNRIEEAIAFINPQDEKFYDIGIFHQGKRIAGLESGTVCIDRTFSPFLKH